MTINHSRDQEQLLKDFEQIVITENMPKRFKPQ